LPRNSQFTRGFGRLGALDAKAYFNEVGLLRFESSIDGSNSDRHIDLPSIELSPGRFDDGIDLEGVAQFFEPK